MTRTLLPPGASERLKCAVKQAAFDAFGGPGTAYGGSVLHHAGRKRTLKLIAELKCRVDEALFELFRDYNSQNVLVGRLPDELLCLVFSFQPTLALISATHVCTKWRSVALANPMLWCRIDYELDWHHDKCDCNRKLPWGCVSSCRSGEDDVVGSNSLRRLLDLLPRAGSTLPISLDVQIPRDLDLETASGDLKRLSSALRSYAPRLAALYLHADNLRLPADFLEEFDCLPALRTLSVQWIRSIPPRSESPEGGAGFLDRPLGLPALQTLQLATRQSDKRIIPEALPSLTSLDFRFVATDSILAYLTIAPRLRKLRVRCPQELYVEPEEAYERVRAQMPAGDVAVVDIIPSMEPAVLAMFDCAAHTSILLGYPYSGHPGSPADGLRILRHLDAVEELCIVCRPEFLGYGSAEKIVMSARGPTGQVRTLTGFWRDEGVRYDVWDNLKAPPRSLVIDSRLWTVPAKIAVGVEKLTVFLSSVYDLNELVEDVTFLAAPFVALEELKIAAQPWEKVPPVSSASLQSFLQSLSVPGGVASLRVVLDSIKIDGDGCIRLCSNV